MIYQNKKVDFPLTGAFSTDSVNCSQLRFISYHIHAVGAVTRNMKLQASNDNINWLDVPGVVIAIGAAGEFGVSKDMFTYGWCRLVSDAGTGTLGAASTIYFSGKF